MVFAKLRTLLTVSVLYMASSVFADRMITVTDAENVRLPGAAVSVLSETDSTLLDAAISDEEGRAFLVRDIAPSSIIIASLVGYQDYINRANQIDSVIVLERNSRMLDEVIVTANREQLIARDGKFIFSPGKLATEVPSAMDMIKYVPMLSAEHDQIKIIGGIQAKILINGRDPKMGETEVVQLLKNTPSENIKRIEIIPTQNAGYTGRSVNIVIDDPTQGIQGMSSAYGLYANSRFSPTLSSSVGYAKNKLQVKTLLYWGMSNSKNSVISEYNYKDISKLVENHSIDYSRYDQLSGRLSINYNFSSKSIAGVSIRVGGEESKKEYLVNAKETYGQITSEESFNSLWRSPWQRPYISAVAFWNYQLDSKGSNVDLTLDYYNSQQNAMTDYTQNNSAWKETNDYLNDGFHLLAKWYGVLNNRHRIDAGYEFSTLGVKESNEMRYSTYDFHYSEYINSVYASWMASWASWFYSNIGVRMENTRLNGHGSINDSPFSQNYTDLLPNISLSFYLPKGSQSITLGASKSITRVSYLCLNPAIVWTSPTTYTTGNPELGPSRSWRLMLNYNFLSDWSVMLYYSQGRDLNQHSYAKDGYTVTQYSSLGKHHSLTFSLNYSHAFWNVWHTYAQLYYMRSKFIANPEMDYLSFTDNNGGFEWNNLVTLSQRYAISAELGYSIRSAVRIPSYVRPLTHSLSASIAKRFGQNVTLKLSVDNILRRKLSSSLDNEVYSFSTNYLESPLSIQLAFSYAFGKRRVNLGQDRSMTNAEKRK